MNSNGGGGGGDKVVPNILICGVDPNNSFYTAWSVTEMSMIKIIKNNGVELGVGKYCRLENKHSVLLKSEYPTNVLTDRNGKSVVVVKAPVFVGNQCPRTKQYIGYSNFFGRVFIDNTCSALRLEQFKTYMCSLRTAPNFLSRNGDGGEGGCCWVVRQVIRPDVPLKYFLLEAKVERVNDEKIHCVKDNIVMELRQQDLRQHCFDDLFNLLTVYVIAFRNPECPNRYTTCFATLLDDFGAELARNSMVAEPTSQCCDKKAAERISILTNLMHDPSFVEEYLSNYPDLKERLFSLMTGVSQKNKDPFLQIRL